MKQVSALESTIQTCELPQAQRIMDPQLAMKKYRRSAAGSTLEQDDERLVTVPSLHARLKQLIYIAATRQASKEHPPVSLQIWSEFLTLA